MKWSCSTARRRLAEYHDGELTIDQRVAIQEHLRACAACEAEAGGLNTIGSALRAAAAGHAWTDGSRELDGMAAGVISRFRAEREESLGRTVQRMFEDLHLVWAALGATAATFACLAITVGIFYFSRAERPDSLAAIIHSLELNDSEVVLPHQQGQGGDVLAAMPEGTTDEEIMLDTTITRDGRVASLQLMTPDGPTGKSDQVDWQAVGSVLDSVARARFAPARVGGEPVAVKMFWYFTHMTVRAKAPGEVRRTVVGGPTHVA